MMLNLIRPFWGADLFIPHGHCYLWKPELVGLHILADTLIAFAYYSIPLTLFYFVRRRQDLPFTWLFLLFSVFIVACGTTHVLEIWTLWHPTYWLSGVIKLVTAVASLATAVSLVQIIPKALALPSPLELELANQTLKQEIAERKRIEAELIHSRDLHEAIFNESADALFLVDPQTLLTLDCNRRAVELFGAADKTNLIGIEGHTLQRHQFSPDELNRIGAEIQSKGFWNREIEYLTFQGNLFWGNIAVKPITIAEQAMNLVRVSDITDRKRAEDEHKQFELSLARLAAIVESSGDAIIGKSLEGVITSWNAGAENIFGYTAEEVLGRSIAILVPPDCADELTQILQQVGCGETIESYETVRVRKDGERIDIASTISPIKDATGKIIGASNIARNITERQAALREQQRTEIALRESEARFQAFMTYSPIAAWITDANGLMLQANPLYLHTRHHFEKDIVGKTIFELYPVEIANHFLHTTRQVIATNQVFEEIDIVPRQDGTVDKFLVYKFPISGLAEQTLVGGVAIDITEQEQVKEQLRSLNERLQYLLTHTPVIIFSCRTEGDYGATSVSENIRTILGYEPQKMLEDPSFWANHIHPDDRDRIFTNLSQIFTTGHYAHEYRFLHGDGTYRWVYNQLQLMRDDGGYPIEIVGYLVDISNRKQAETVIQQSEARYRAIVEDQMELIVRFQPDGTLTFVNDAYCRYFGIQREQLIGHRYAPVVFAEDRERVDQLVRSMNQENPIVVIENRVVVGGEVRWTQWFNRALFDAQGGLNEIQAVGRDVHNLKQAEENLRQSEERLQLALEASGDGLWDWNIQTGEIYYSPRYFEMLGYEADELPKNISTWEHLVHPDDMVWVRETLAAHLKETSVSYKFDYRLQTKSGEWKWVANYGKVVARDGQGNPLRMIGTHRDVDDRKQAEQALQEQEAFLRAIGDNIPNGYLYQLVRELDGRYRFTYVSAGIERVSGLKPKAILADSSLMFNLLVEDDIPYLIQRAEDSAQNLSVFDIQVRERFNTGETRWLRLCSTPRRQEDGRVVWDGIRLDIHDLKQTEESLRQSEERWHLAVLGSNDGIWDHNLQTNDHYLSPRCMEISGYEGEEIDTFDKWLQHVHPDDIGRLQTSFQAHIEHRLSSYACEYRMGCKDGSYKWLLARGQALWDTQGKPLRAVGSLTDISDRKRTEEALSQSEAKNRAMLAAIPDLLLRVQRDGTCLDFIPPTAPEAGTFLSINTHLSEILPPDLLQYQLQRMEQALATNELQVWEHQILKGNTLCDEEVRVIPCGKEEVLIIVRDISEAKRREAERKQAEESLRRYERIVSATTDAILLVDHNYVYQVVNQAYLNWYNKRQDEVVGHTVTEVLSQELFENTIKPRLDQCLAGQVVQYEMWMDYPVLGAQFLSLTYDPYFDPNGAISGVVVSLRNITRLKQAELELELQSIVARNMAEGVCMVKVRDGIFVYTNPKFERMFGYDADELIGQHVAIVNYKDRSTNTTETYEELAKAILEQGEATYEVHNIKKDGTLFWGQATTSVFEHPDYGAVFVVVHQDVTERKQAEEQIQASLKEKEVLLKEIHHRVKNNLGIVDGLLQMQARRSQNSQIIETLKESQNRISSIALIHEKLYLSEDLANIDFSQYIPNLIAYLFNSYNIYPNRVTLTTQVDNIPLNIDTAIPCGLIINELVSNALKYAFPDNRAGAIQVNFCQNLDGTLTLTVIDDGVGLPSGFDLKRTKTLGITLVQGLVKQLGGELEIDNQPGTTVRINLKGIPESRNS